MRLDASFRPIGTAPGSYIIAYNAISTGVEETVVKAGISIL